MARQHLHRRGRWLLGCELFEILPDLGADVIVVRPSHDEVVRDARDCLLGFLPVLEVAGHVVESCTWRMPNGLQIVPVYGSENGAANPLVGKTTTSTVFGENHYTNGYAPTP